MVELNIEQKQALSEIKNFLNDATLDVFILRGSAGTGKTTLIAKLAQYLININQSFALLAPTGRAARILSAKIKQHTNLEIKGLTIHRMIYRLDNIMSKDDAVLSVDDPALRFYYPLKAEEPTVNLFIIDESSMVGDRENKGDLIRFGSGRLLKDILEFCRTARLNRKNDHITKILFVGDIAQLPPVSEEFSPALSEQYLSDNYGIESASFDLTCVMRQTQDGSVLKQATAIRNSIAQKQFNTFGIDVNNIDILSLNNEQALAYIVNHINNRHSSIAVVYSNESALSYNRNIREKIYGDANAPIKIGDLLLVNKNSNIYQLSNGDLVKVIHVCTNSENRSLTLKTKQKDGKINDEIVSLIFRNIRVAYRSIYGDIQIDCFVLENLLNSKNRELSTLEIRALYVDFLIRNPQVKNNPELKKELLKVDPYFNALQVKYGYAITCHKAQGGEWQNVLVDFKGIKGFNNQGFFQWAYTAITRTSKNLVVVNPPKFNAASTMVWDNLTSDNLNIEHKIENDINNIQSPLDVIHNKLLKHWGSLGIKDIKLNHLQYCERYTLTFENQHIQVQYYYNGKFKITKYEIIPNQNVDKEFLNKILSAFDSCNIPQNYTNNFIDKFIKHIENCLSSSNIKIVNHKIMQYRLRVKFSDDKRIGEIDFNFNGKQQWTSVQEVGGIGVTDGLYQEIATLVKNGKDR